MFMFHSQCLNPKHLPMDRGSITIEEPQSTHGSVIIPGHYEFNNVSLLGFAGHLRVLQRPPHPALRLSFPTRLRSAQREGPQLGGDVYDVELLASNSPEAGLNF
ncbi:hypothetical protein GOP47_0027560 [Adiantum capillus-veneris]|nr:hypothetical protein GOP47_0027560 [Adiantum capillus-veneris]